MTEFAHIVSLGYRCRTAARLRSHFGFETAYPFDWWVTPIGGAVRFLGDWDVDALYDPAELDVIWKNGRPAFVEHKAYGLRLQHEFPRDAEGFVLPGWRDGVADARARTAALMGRIEAMDSATGRALFIREARVDEGSRQLERLRAAVQARAPKADAEFVLVSPDGKSAPGWRTLVVEDLTVKPWDGDPAIWDRALASLGVTVRAAEPALS